MKGALSAGTDLQRLLLAAAINAVLFAIVLTFLTLGWESNDDVSMMHVVSGITTGTPSAEILFSNVLIGNVLKHLYRLTDRVNWYTLYLLGVHFATMTGLLFGFLRMRLGRMAVILFVMLFSQFEVAVLLLLQFTSTSVISGVVGVLLIVTARGDDDEKSHVAVSYGGLLIVLSGLIRAEGMYYAFVLLLPYLVFQTLTARPWRPLANMGVFVVVALMAVQYNNWHYQRDPHWRSFMQYNVVRASVHDLPIVQFEPNTRFFFDRIGWSYNDWGMLNNWFFTDSETFSQEHLQTIVDRFRGSGWIRDRASQYKADSLASVAAFIPTMYANVVLAILLGAGRRFRMSIIGAAACLWVAMLLTLFSWYAKLPERMTLPAFFTVSVVAFTLALQASAERRYLIRSVNVSPTIRPSGVLLAAVFCIYYATLAFRVASFHVTESNRKEHQHRVFRSFVRAVLDNYVDKNPNAIFLNWGGRFPVQYDSVFDNARDYRRIKMLGLGWNTHSPQFDEAVARWQLGNLYQATYRNPNVYLFAAPISLVQLSRFVHEHYQQEIRVNRRDTYFVDSNLPPKYCDFDLTVYQMALETPAVEAAAIRADDIARKSP